MTNNLKPGEEVKDIVLRYGLTFTPIGFIGLILLLLPFFLLFPLFRWGLWGVLIFFVLIALAVVFILRILYVWYFNVFLITNQRVIDIDQRGFFSRKITETNYEKIQDVSSMVKGIFQTMFKYGKVDIQTAGAEAYIEIKKVYQPKVVQDLITEAQKKYQDQENEHGATPDDLKRVITKLRAHVGEKKFREVLGPDKNLF